MSSETRTLFPIENVFSIVVSCVMDGKRQVVEKISYEKDVEYAITYRAMTASGTGL